MEYRGIALVAEFRIVCEKDEMSSSSSFRVRVVGREGMAESIEARKRVQFAPL